MRAAERQRRQHLDDEVAIGDRVEAVRRRTGEAEPGGEPLAIDRERASGEGAASERAGIRALRGVGETSVVPAEPVEVREQEMGEEDRLRALQVRVARNGVAAVPLGEIDEGPAETPQRLSRSSDGVDREEPQIRGDLIVPGPTGVELARRLADLLRETLLDERVDVLERTLEEARVRRGPFADPAQPGVDRRAFGLAQDSGRVKRLGPRLARMDLVRQEPAVVRVRVREAREERVGLRAEPRSPEGHR